MVAEEAALVVNFKDDLEDLKKELSLIGACLAEFHKKKDKNEVLQIWSTELHDIVYDTDDVLEKCESMMASTNCLTKIYIKYKVGKKVREVKKKIVKTRERYGNPSESYKFPDIPGGIPETGLPLDEPKTVGMEGHITLLSHWLSEEPHARIMAVVGMGGMGKTLLLRRIQDKMRSMFECCLWLTISHNFSVKELHTKIGRVLKIDQVDNLSEEDARSSISDHLRTKTSLIFLDDVWDGKDLLEKIGIPACASCRIIISTRDENVARELRATRIHPMQHLSEDDSWRLFCLFAFPQSEGVPVPPPELAEVALEIARKCSRLPLAIKTIAASMAGKKRPNEWTDALCRINELKEGGVRPILQVSYDVLPSPLQICFLYCSVFPKDRKINCQYLIELWIAEGFVQTKPDLNSSPAATAVDVGRSYLNQLVSRSLLEPSVVGDDGRVEFCRMHDLLRELALAKASKYLKCFFSSQRDLKEILQQDYAGHRRISLMQNDIVAMPPINLEPLRALFLSGNRKLSEIHLERLKSLRILDLSYTGITELSVSLKRLEHLRVLNLSSSNIKELPESIGHLQRLHYMDLSRCNNLGKLPSAIGALKLLRYLNLRACKMLEVMPVEISRLTSLETLILGDYKLLPGHNLRFDHLQRLEKLRELDADMGVVSESGDIPEDVFTKLGKMRRLRLYNHGQFPLHLPKDMEKMCELEKLYLYGIVPPSWLPSFRNLVALELQDCNCRMYPRLDDLPNLCHLILCGNTECSEFPKEFGRANGFPNLERLRIEHFQKLKGLPALQDGAMPKLKSLGVKDCPQVMGIPPGLEDVQSLAELTVLRCSRGAQARLEEGGEDDVRLKSKLPDLTITVRGVY